MSILNKISMVSVITLILSACVAPTSPAVEMNKYRINSSTLNQIIEDNKQPQYSQDTAHEGQKYTFAQYCQSPNATGGWTAYGMSLGMLEQPYSSYQAFLFKDNILVDITAYDVPAASVCERRFKHFKEVYFSTLR